MMNTYLTIRDFRRRVNARGEEYGWAVSVYSTPEALFGRELVTSAYQLQREEAYEKLFGHMRERFPDAAEKDIRRLLR